MAVGEKQTPAEESRRRETGSAVVSGRDFRSAPATDLQALAAQQNVKPVAHFEDLLGDFWPEDESADDFVATVRQWRREGGLG